MDFLHALVQFVIATVVAVVAMYFVYLYYRQRYPQLNLAKLTGKAGQGKAPTLLVESSQYLEPKRSVHIIQADEERFLIASSENGIQLLSPLQRQATQDVALLETEEVQPSIPQQSAWANRMTQSIKTVFQERVSASKK